MNAISIYYFPSQKRAYLITIQEILLGILTERSLACRGFTSHRFEVPAVFHVYLFLSTGQLVLYPPYLFISVHNENIGGFLTKRSTVASEKAVMVV
jgi:hypothetical protein